MGHIFLFSIPCKSWITFLQQTLRSLADHFVAVIFFAMAINFLMLNSRDIQHKGWWYVGGLWQKEMGVWWKPNVTKFSPPPLDHELINHPSYFSIWSLFVFHAPFSCSHWVLRHLFSTAETCAQRLSHFPLSNFLPFYLRVQIHRVKVFSK